MDGEGEINNQNAVYVLYTKRWLVLAVFSLISMSNEVLWISLSSITSIVRQYYRVDAIIVDWLSLIFLLFLLLVSLSSYFLNKYGLKVTIIVGALLNALGSCLRLAGSNRDGITFVFIGSTFAAIAQCFLFFIPPRLAAVWFGEHERATASSVGMVLTFAGVAVGFLTAGSFVPPSQDMDHAVRTGMFNLLMFQAVLCCFLALVSFCTIEDRPPTPPSRSQQLVRTENVIEGKAKGEGPSSGIGTASESSETKKSTEREESIPLIGRGHSIPMNEPVANTPLIESESNGESIAQDEMSLSFKESLIILMKNKHFHAQCQTYSIYFGVICSFDTTLNLLVTSRFPGREVEIAYIGFIAVSCGAATMLVCGIIIDRARWYRAIALVCFSVGALLIIAFAVQLKNGQSFGWLCALVVLFGPFSHMYISVGLEYAAETMYPVHEGITSASLLFLSSIYTIILVYIVDPLVEGGLAYISGFIFAALYGVAFLLTCCVRPPLKRTQADKNINFE